MQMKMNYIKYYVGFKSLLLWNVWKHHQAKNETDMLLQHIKKCELGNIQLIKRGSVLFIGLEKHTIMFRPWSREPDWPISFQIIQ